MQLKQLCARHPRSDEKLFLKYQCLFQGGKLFRDNIKSFLNIAPNEDVSNYIRRCQEASYRSYIAPIINDYSSKLFSAPYVIRASRNENDIKLDEFYTQFKEDVDLVGTDLTSFLKCRFQESLVKGASYWIAELPDDGMEWPENLSDFKERGLDRAYLREIPTESLTDWECDDLGNFEWCIVHSKKYKRVSPISDRSFCTETWKIYDNQNVEIFQITYEPSKKPKATDEVQSIGKFPHHFSRIPIIGICLPYGLWLTDLTADAQIEHFRLSAALGWNLRRSANAVPVFKLKSADSPPVATAAGMIIGQEEDFAFVEPNGGSTKTLQDEIEKQKDEIYRISSQMALSVNNYASNIGRSGTSKQEDKAVSDVCLSAYATIVKEAIEKTYELISDARGDYDIKFSIEGMNQFNSVDVSQLIEDAKIARELNIQSETFHKELDYRIAEIMLPFDTKQDIKDAVKQEILSAKPNMTDIADKKMEEIQAQKENKSPDEQKTEEKEAESDDSLDEAKSQDE